MDEIRCSLSEQDLHALLMTGELRIDLGDAIIAENPCLTLSVDMTRDNR